MLALSACTRIETDGPDAQGYRWQRDGMTGTPAIHRNVDVYLSCAFEEKATACSIIREGQCDIYLPSNPEPWMEAHELRHCAGWRHPNPLRAAL